VIQHSKRKNYEFVDSWGTSLQRATTLVRDDKVKEKVLRIFRIWEQREVYSEEFIADLTGLLSIKKAQIPTTPVKPTSPIVTQTRSEEFDDEFQLLTVVSNIKNCVALENETDKNLKIVKTQTQTPDIERTKAQFKGDYHIEDYDIEDNAKRFL